MKKHRGKVFTQGIVITNKTNDDRFPFFELDFEHKSGFLDVVNAYRDNGIDYLCHRTGNGYHFLSPCLLSKEEWKKWHLPIKHLNPTCPMTTLRWWANKYPNEMDIWTVSEFWKAKPTNYWRNADALCNLLNKTFGSDFAGGKIVELKFVKYPLPEVITN